MTIMPFHITPCVLCTPVILPPATTATVIHHHNHHCHLQPPPQLNIPFIYNTTTTSVTGNLQLRSSSPTTATSSHHRNYHDHLQPPPLPPPFTTTTTVPSPREPQSANHRRKPATPGTANDTGSI
ncbi:hypothetical protein Hanom_Chr12g01171431 [Helianthus anomalus]